VKKLCEKYEKFSAKQSEFIRKRKDLLEAPEKELKELADDLGVHTLRAEIQGELRKKMDKAWKLWRKIWDKDPTPRDVDKFLHLSEEIQFYTEFLRPDTIRMWKAITKLVLNFKKNNQEHENDDA